MTPEKLEEWAEECEEMASLFGPPDTPHREAEWFARAAFLRRLAAKMRKPDAVTVWNGHYGVIQSKRTLTYKAWAEYERDGKPRPPGPPDPPMRPILYLDSLDDR